MLNKIIILFLLLFTIIGCQSNLEQFDQKIITGKITAKETCRCGFKTPGTGWGKLIYVQSSTELETFEVSDKEDIFEIGDTITIVIKKYKANDK